MQTNKSYIVIIISLVILASGLAYLNFNSTGSEIPIETADSTSTVSKPFNYDDYFIAVRDSIKPAIKFKIDSLEQLIKTDTGNYQAHVLLARLYDESQLGLVAAQYVNDIAIRLNDERSWFNAGFKFYDFAANTIDTGAQIYASKKAIAAFEKVIAINEHNLEAKNAMAICYVQNDLDVMAGVQLLKDVIKRDSNNVQANYTLGMLSRRSGQWDKARIRFEKLAQLDPLNSEAYFYLGEAYSSLNMKKEAIIAYETCMNLIPSANEDSKKEIKKLIDNLKQTK
ncbi:MAG: tetratricopeptide repeat protein [Bacteroidia bacterium]|jgi:tetratricopeptide (TPR) repeat protein